MFFYSTIQINIYGHLSPPVSQLRGVRQGDPLSPLLFNLVFEPPVQRILYDSHIQGYQIESPYPGLVAPPPAKILAYADDALVFLRSESVLLKVMSYLTICAAAPKAKVNWSKTTTASTQRLRALFRGTAVIRSVEVVLVTGYRLRRLQRLV